MEWLGYKNILIYSNHMFPQESKWMSFFYFRFDKQIKSNKEIAIFRFNLTTFTQTSA